ncbi:MAG TPA: IS5 family transposase [Cyclobacteriaceae bacterium]|nr:IS5 family transposase [Cyclobacteriaceae bacterium]
MRGEDISQPKLFVTTTVNDFVPKNHPLRSIRRLLDSALEEIDSHFDEIYSDMGRESVAPERLIRASLLQVLFTVRSERQLIEQIRYNMLFRWFVGLEIDDQVWHHSTFTKNRERLLEHKVLPALFSAVLRQARKRHLLSDEHFSVDGTLIDAWASHKSFRPRDEDDDGGPQSREVDFHGERRTNETHVSKTDPDAELMRKSKGKESRLRYGVHHLMENRNCLVVGVKTTKAASVTERVAAQELLIDQPGEHRKTVGGDKGFDTCDFVEDCRILNVTPHVAQNIERKGGSAIDRRTTRHSGYTISQRKRKMIETTFGWAKQYGGLRRMMYRGLDRVEGVVIFTMTVFNLLRICNLQPKWQE